MNETYLICDQYKTCEIECYSKIPKIYSVSTYEWAIKDLGGFNCRTQTKTIHYIQITPFQYKIYLKSKKINVDF